MITVLLALDLYPSLDRDEISRFVSLSLTGLEDGIISRRKTTTPRPPMKCVDDLQKSRLSGNASTSSRIVAPVVV